MKYIDEDSYEELHKKIMKYEEVIDILKSLDIKVAEDPSSDTGYYVYIDSEISKDEYSRLSAVFNREGSKE